MTMKRIASFIAAAMVGMTMTAQTLNVEVGQVTYQIPAADAGEMVYSNGETLTIVDKVYTLSDIAQIYVNDAEVSDTTVNVEYSGGEAKVVVDGRIAKHLTVSVEGAHVSVTPSDDMDYEVTYALSGISDDGEFALGGNYKATVELRGLTLTNPSGAPINISNGKRIALSVKKDTENTLTDSSNGKQKAALYCKGHLELKGKGTLNVYGNTAHAIKSGDYMSMKNCTVNVLGAVKDGLSANEFFLMESGTLTISGVGDDGIQVDLDGDNSTGETAGHEDEDTGSIYIEDGKVTISVTADGAKGMKAAGDMKMSGGQLTVTQTGSIVADTDLSYPTSIKTDGSIVISGGNITINNTADGGKGMSADGDISIDESAAAVTIDVTANGKGGTAELAGTSEEEETPSSYVVYVSLPTSGNGGAGGRRSAWTSLYLYKEDGTLVQQLTSTVSKSNGYSNTTFYYYDFGAADSGNYYFKSDDYTGGQGSTYTIVSTTFTGPTSGTDMYYSISNSYQTSGSTRTYTISNVTSTYSGTSDIIDEDGTAYNAMGIKADGNLTIGAGTITVKNSGEMSKSLKSKATLTINGGNITLTPSGAMKVINSDASYSTGIKAVDYVQNDGTVTINVSGTAGKGVSTTSTTTNGGTLTITNAGAPVDSGSGDYYTAKGIKADGDMALNGGTISISMTGNGGKGIKVNGKYTQGTSDGSGPALTVSTTGSSAGGNTGGGGGGWGGPGGWGGSSSSGSAKAIKVMGTIVVYGGTTEVSTATDGAEGLESKVSIDIRGGKHYFKCYDDCINSAGAIYFNGGVTVCYSNGNDAVDSNYGRTGAITIGDGAVFAFSTRGGAEEGLDCDNNSYIQITGTGYAISAGGAQGGGGGSSTVSNAKQGYKFVTNTISYQAGRYYTLSDASYNNLVTYSFPASCSSSLSLFTAKGMVKGSTYLLRYSTKEPTDATTQWHGLYLGSSHKGDSGTDLITTSGSQGFTAQ